MRGRRRDEAKKQAKKNTFTRQAMLMFAFAFFRFNTIDAQAASKYTIYVNRKTIS